MMKPHMGSYDGGEHALYMPLYYWPTIVACYPVIAESPHCIEVLQLLQPAISIFFNGGPA